MVYDFDQATTLRGSRYTKKDSKPKRRSTWCCDTLALAEGSKRSSVNNNDNNNTLPMPRVAKKRKLERSNDESNLKPPPTASLSRINLLDDWMETYEQLVVYKKKHGTTCVPQRYEADPQLGIWVHRQRSYCKEKDRIDLLNAIGFEWQLIEMNDWGVMYERLLTYKAKHGTACVSTRYKADPKLGSWVKTQRQYCKEKDRIDLLNAIGFVWKLSERNDWGAMYQRLLTYKKKHGTTCVPQRYKADPQLGRWVKVQRKCNEKDRIDLLNAIGFVWKVSKNWGIMYKRLLTYKEKHGTTRVPQSCKADPQLGQWVYTQRRHCKDKDRIDLLNDIGFVWNPRGSSEIDTEGFIII